MNLNEGETRFKLGCNTYREKMDTSLSPAHRRYNHLANTCNKNVAQN